MSVDEDVGAETMLAVLAVVVARCTLPADSCSVLSVARMNDTPTFELSNSVFLNDSGICSFNLKNFKF